MSKTFINTVRNGSIWSASSIFILKLIGLSTVFLVLHKLTIYEYGVLEITLSCVALFKIFLLPGFSNTIVADMGVQRSKGNVEGVHSIFRQFFSLQLILGFVAFLCVFFGSNILAHYYNAHIGILFKIMSFIFLTSIFRTSMMSVYSVYFKFSSQSIYTILEEASRLVFVFLFLYIFDFRMQGVVLAVVLSQVSALLLMLPTFLSVRKMFSIVKVTSPESCWNLLKHHGKWGIFSTYLGTLTQNIRIFFIKIFLGTETVALFALASGLLSHTLSLFPLTSIIAPIVPQYINFKDKFLVLIQKTLKYQLLNTIVVLCASYAILPTIISFLFPKYKEVIPLFRALLPALIPLSFANVFTPIFYALKAQKNLFFSNILKFLSVVILLPICLSMFGFFGIAIEYVINSTIFALERYRVIKKRLPDFHINTKGMMTIDENDHIILDSVFGYFRKRI